MTTLAINLAVIAIILFCGWRGYKNGLIRGVFGVVSLIVALLVGNIVATAYSEDFTVMLDPFVSGLVESTFTNMRDEGVEYDAEEHDHQNKTEDFGKAYTVLRLIGISETASVRVAEASLEPEEQSDANAEGGDENEHDGEDSSGVRIMLTDKISTKLSSILAYVAVFAIAFILIAIILAVLGNLVSFVFSLPGLKLVDIIAGVALGLFKGFIIVYALAAIVRYFGLIAPQTIEEASILNYFVNNNPIANILGI